MYLDGLDDMQREILIGTHRSGRLSPGAPIAYVPRTLNRKAQEQLHILMRGLDDESHSALAARGLPSTKGRSVGHLTTTDLNTMSEALSSVDKKASDQLKVLASESGAYSTDPLAVLGNRLAQEGEHWNTINLSTNLIDAAQDVSRVRVVGFVEKGTEAVKLFEGKGVKSKIDGLGDVDTHVLGPEDMVHSKAEIGSLIVQHPDGGLGAIHTGIGGHIGEGRAILDTSEGVLPFARGEGAPSAFEGALANIITEGDPSKVRNMLIEDPVAMTGKRALDLAGKELVYGDSATLKTMLGYTSSITKGGVDGWEGYDTVHNLMKKFQTIFRPAFHTANMASGYFQSIMAGHGVKNTTLSMLDSARFLHAAEEYAAMYSKASRRVGEGSGFTLTRMVRTAGYDVSRYDAAAEKGYKASDLSSLRGTKFQLSDGRSYDVEELVEAMIEENLFGSYVSETLRGTSSLNKRIEMLQKHASGDLTPAGKVGRALDKGQDFAEGSETFVRLQNFFAGIRSGLDPRTAAGVSAEWNIRYSQRTSFEKTWMNRATTYYTFPRKFIPLAWSKFAEDPARAAELAATLKSGLQDGILVDADGQINVRLGESDWRHKLQRSHAGVDAMVGMGAAVQYLVPSILDDRVDDITRTHNLPAFFQWGPLAQKGVEFFSESEPGDPGLISMDTLETFIPHVRWLTDNMGPEPAEPQNTSFEEHLGEKVFGSKKVREKHEERLYKSRFEVIKRTIRREMQIAAANGRTEELKELREELKEAARIYKGTLEKLDD